MVYSFDIFDTLITRRTKEPSDIFRIIQERLSDAKEIKISDHIRDNYAYFRRTSETFARRSYYTQEEISIEDIYRVLFINSNVSQLVIDELIDFEVSIEQEFCIPITDNLEKLYAFIKAGEKVVLISDMYLHEDQIRNILIPINEVFKTIPIYVSCDCGLTKGSKHLYEFVSQKEGVLYDAWTHFGDNEFSDVIVPRQLGIKSVFLPLQDLDEYSFYNKRMAISEYPELFSPSDDKSESFPFRLGKEVSVSVLIPYILFILRESINRCIGRLLFVARDGYILKLLADSLIRAYSLPISTSYVYGSRIAWRIPDVFDDEFRFRYYLIQQGLNGEYTLSDISKILQIDPQVLMKCLGFCYMESELEKKHIISDDSDVLPEIMDGSFELKSIFANILDSKRQLVSEYVRSMIPEDTLSAFVEVQGTGATQISLSEILPEKCIYTFYMLKSSLLKTERTIFSVYYNDYDDVLNPLIELFTRAPHGITVGYSRSDNGTLLPLLQDDDYVQQIEHGYEDYIRGAVSSIESILGYSWDNLAAFNLLPMSLDYLDELNRKQDEEYLNYIGDMPISTLWQGNNTILRFAPPPDLYAAMKYRLYNEIEKDKYRGCCFEFGLYRLSEVNKKKLDLCNRIIEKRRSAASVLCQSSEEISHEIEDIHVSVIITTYNRKYEVRRTLDSVYAQTCKPYEIIMVDCGSTDGTVEYINSFVYDGLRIIEVNTERVCSPGYARNIGIKTACGNYVSFIDSNCEWDPNWLQIVMDHLRIDPDADIVFSQYYRHHMLDRFIQPVKGRVEYYLEKNEIYPLDILDASAAVFSKKYLIDIGMFNEELYSCIDWEIILGGELVLIPKTVYINMPLSEKWEIYDDPIQNTELRIYEKLILFMTYFREVSWREREFSFVRALYTSELIFGEENQLMKQIIEYDPELIKQLLDDKGEYSHELVCLRDESAQLHSQIINLNNSLNRKAKYYDLTREWIALHESGRTMTDILHERGYHNIAVYGAGKHGELFIGDIDSYRVSISYVIDKNKTEPVNGIRVIKPGDPMEGIDAVIVTPLIDIGSLREELNTSAYVISLYDLLGEQNG